MALAGNSMGHSAGQHSAVDSNASNHGSTDSRHVGAYTSRPAEVMLPAGGSPSSNLAQPFAAEHSTVLLTAGEGNNAFGGGRAINDGNPNNPGMQSPFGGNQQQAQGGEGMQGALPPIVDFQERDALPQGFLAHMAPAPSLDFPLLSDLGYGGLQPDTAGHSSASGDVQWAPQGMDDGSNDRMAGLGDASRQFTELFGGDQCASLPPLRLPNRGSQGFAAPNGYSAPMNQAPDFTGMAQVRPDATQFLELRIGGISFHLGKVVHAGSC